MAHRTGPSAVTNEGGLSEEPMPTGVVSVLVPTDKVHFGTK